MVESGQAERGPNFRRGRILIADDHEVVRRGLRIVVEAAGHEVCAEACTGREAVDLAHELRPDLVILDLSMPDLGGLEATRQIRAAMPSTEVLVLTIQRSENVVREVLAAGARGYVLKSDLARDLVGAVTAVLDHKTFFTPTVGDVVLSGFLSGGAEDADAEAKRLTPREREIVQLVAEGYTTKQIARKLAISVKTVETHRGNVLRTLGLHSVSEIVLYAVRNGIVES